MLSTSKILASNTARIAPKYARAASWIPSKAASSLPTRRALKKLKVGEVRPAIYYKFDCTVELSDGSTIKRRSQFPKAEMRYLADQRTHSLWNPSRPNIKAMEADATGKMAKFKQRYGNFDSATTETEEGEEEDMSFFDMVGDNAQEVLAGGKLAVTRRWKKKKGKKSPPGGAINRGKKNK